MYQTHFNHVCRQSTKLKIMIISINTNVLIKFEASKMTCWIQDQKPMKCVHLLILTCTKHTSTTSPVHETQDYDY